MATVDFARFRAVLGAALMLIVSILAMSGCSPISPEQTAPERWSDAPEVDDEVLTHFTEEQVGEAYRWLTDFAFDRAFPAELTDPQRADFTVDDLADPVSPYMTSTLLQKWTVWAETALSVASPEPSSTGSIPTEADSSAEEAADNLRVVQFFGWENDTWTLPADETPLDWQSIEESYISFESETQRLQIGFDHHAEFTFVELGDEISVPVSKTITFWLAQDADRGWLIDNFLGHFIAIGETTFDSDLQE